MVPHSLTGLHFAMARKVQKSRKDALSSKLNKPQDNTSSSQALIVATQQHDSPSPTTDDSTSSTAVTSTQQRPSEESDERTATRSSNFQDVEICGHRHLIRTLKLYFQEQTAIFRYHSLFLPPASSLAFRASRICTGQQHTSHLIHRFFHNHAGIDCSSHCAGHQKGTEAN